MMMTKTPIRNYVTPSDLAFGVLVLEHHLSKWRQQVQYKLETGGRRLSGEAARNLNGLVYHGGIAGEDAKRRFDSLAVYFFLNYYSGIGSDDELNMSRLQKVLDAGIDFDINILEAQIQDYDYQKNDLPGMDEIKKDIIHCVFYYLH